MDLEAAGLTPKNSSVAFQVRHQLYQLVRGTDGGPEVSLDQTADSLYRLCIKLAPRKDDVKVALQVLRDELARAEFTSEQSVRVKQVETLFKLFDELERRAAIGVEGSDEQAAVIFEELRARFTRMIVGDKWDDAPRLRLMALRRIYAYKVNEAALSRQRSTVSRSLSLGSDVKLTRKLSRRLSVSTGSISVGTWEEVLEDLVKAPSSKLFPLMKMMLMDEGSAVPPTLLIAGKPARSKSASEHTSQACSAANTRGQRQPAERDPSSRQPCQQGAGIQPAGPG